MAKPPALQPRPAILTLPHSIHGALDYGELERLGIDPATLVDFSANINPYGPSPAVRAAIQATPPEQYPDRETLALRRALGAYHNLPIEHILCANGSAEILWLLALAYLRPGDKTLVLSPAFGEYAQAARLMESPVDVLAAGPEHGFTHNPLEVEQTLKNTIYRLVFICNPNNPTGQVIPLERLSAWIKTCPLTLFIVDEAYLPFVAGLDSAVELGAENLLVLRSMTKDFALAGLRLGYAIATPTLISALEAVSPPWHVNALAQAAGLAALQDLPYREHTLGLLRAEKERLIAGLMERGYRPVAGRTPYFLLPVGNGAQFRANLLKHGLQVRDCASFGLPEYVRIATRLPHENDKLLKVIPPI